MASLRPALVVIALAAAGPQQTPVTDAARLVESAERLRSTGTAANLKASLAAFDRALAAARTAGDRRSEAAALTGLGRAHDALGDRRRAIGLFTEAIPLYQAGEDRAGECYVLNYMALSHDLLGERAEAARLLDRALPLARAAADRRVEAITLNNLGLIQANTGNRPKALEFYEQALVIHRDVGNLRGQAVTLTNIGTIHEQIGNAQLALKYLMEALPLRRTIGDPRDEATTLNNIGAVYARTDELRAAVEHYEAALPLWRLAGDESGEAATLHNLGNVRDWQGDKQAALDLYQRALVLHRKTQFRAGEGNTLNNLAGVYRSLGRRDKALEVYLEALSVHRTVNNRASEAATLSNIGGEQLALGQPNRASATYTEALALWQIAGDRQAAARTHIGLGRVASSRKDDDAAAVSYRQAIDLARASGSRRTEAAARHNLGVITMNAGRTDEALTLFGEALDIQRQLADRVGEAATLHARARLQLTLGRLSEALADIEGALARTESVRASVTNPDLRMSYFATVQDYFEAAVDVLMRLDAADAAAGWAGRAFEMAERARARSFIDLLAEARLNIREGVDAALLQRERDLAESISAKAEKQARLLGGPHTEAQAAALAGDLAALVASRDEVSARIRSTSPRYAALAQYEPLTAESVRRDLLDADTALLEFALGAARSYGFLVTRDRLRAFVLPPRATIEAAASEFYRTARTPEGADQARAAAGALARLLLEPVGADLRSRRLAIVATGPLEYVPFAALPNPATGRPLIVDHEVTSLPSASVLRSLRTGSHEVSGRPATMLIFADPVFAADDPRVGVRPGFDRGSTGVRPRPESRTGPDPALAPLDRLLGSRREATAIAGLFGKERATTALGFDANRAAVTSGDVGRHVILHFATHAFLDTTRPELSGIVLSLVDRAGQPQNGFVGLGDIFNLRLNAQLVVLSACQTALGQQIRGEGLVGLSRAFMYAGAPRVVASVWKVDDTATAELMTRFYRGLTAPTPLTPAAALRAAQLALLADRRWQAPYYWAAFVLQGDWR